MKLCLEAKDERLKMRTNNVHDSFSSGDNDGTYQSLLTEDPRRVSQALEEPKTIVYKLGGLTRITQIEITYREINEEEHD